MNAERCGRRCWSAARSSLSLALVGVYLAAGGSSYTPEKSQDPCKHRRLDATPKGLQRNRQAVLDLGARRRRLPARGHAARRWRGRWRRRRRANASAERYGIDDAKLARAIRAGLLRAVDDAEEAGALSPFIAGPLRATIEEIPLDQAIELVNDASSLLGNVQTFLGPAGDLLEELLP